MVLICNDLKMIIFLSSERAPGMFLLPKQTVERRRCLWSVFYDHYAPLRARVERKRVCLGAWDEPVHFAILNAIFY